VRGGSGFTAPPGATATAWADALVPEGADTLVHYEHPHLGRWAAVTTHGRGRGRVTYVGTLPDRALAVGLAGWLRRADDAWAARPPAVTVTSARNREGERLHFVSNWSWEPAQVPVPMAVRDLLSEERVPAGAGLDLTAWDVRVLVEHLGEEHNQGRS
jgi:beta-galactosidase